VLVVAPDRLFCGSKLDNEAGSASLDGIRERRSSCRVVLWWVWGMSGHNGDHVQRAAQHRSGISIVSIGRAE